MRLPDEPVPLRWFRLLLGLVGLGIGGYALWYGLRGGGSCWENVDEEALLHGSLFAAGGLFFFGWWLYLRLKGPKHYVILNTRARQIIWVRERKRGEVRSFANLGSLFLQERRVNRRIQTGSFMTTWYELHVEGGPERLLVRLEQDEAKALGHRVAALCGLDFNTEPRPAV